MRNYNGMTTAAIQSVVNGVIAILETGNPRVANPIRLFEQGLISTNSYIRILLWVTAMDGILMAVKESVFVARLCSFLGAASQVFPPEDGVYIMRATTVGDVAEDLFSLRSSLAHGTAIRRRFWEPREDLRHLFSPAAYVGFPTYATLLEEAALSLLSRMLRKIIVEALVDDFSNVKKWRARLDCS
jgi:hypothetical protein